MDDQTKLTMQSQDLSDLKFAQLQALFPQVFTEAMDENGNTIRAINTELLEQEINTKVLDGKKERYEFTWPDKRQAIRMANTPTNAALRPCRKESVDFDTTENLYIEGDNLEVLKLLRETYLNKVKMIYIDPPYNTGKDFVYRDNFTESVESFRERDGQYDDQGNRLETNFDSNGRFHTDWLNMIYSRLKIARDLLTDDGVIFISIDDNEVHNLRKICDEVFGEENFQGHIHWRRRHNQPNDKTKMIGLVAEHILAFSKKAKDLRIAGVGKIDLTGEFSNPDNDPRGDWASKPWKVGSDQSGSRYTIISPTGKIFDGQWMGDQETYKQHLSDNRIIFPKNGNGMPRKKYFRFEREEEGQCATNWWEHQQFGHNQGANDLMTELFGTKNIFSNPKPIELLRGLVQISNVKDEDIVFDFFSGSSSTAHAVIQLNSEDGGKRKYIMVQLPEKTPESSPARSAGFETISDIGKERIRRASRKIKEESPITTTDLDVGFRVLKLDSSNMKEVFYTPDEIIQTNISFDGLVNNIKEDRSDEDLLFQVMLELGIPLSSKIEKREGIFYVEETYLIACFQSVDKEQIREIAQKEPYYVVLRDSSFANDSDSINFDQIFATYSPHTKRRVL